MNPDALDRLISVFDRALQGLGASPSPGELEKLSALIHKAMTLQARRYHNLEHVFAFVDEANPIQTLAGLFHDIVYYQVDLGLLPEIEAIIAPYVDRAGDRFIIPLNAPQEPLFELALEAFEMQRGRPVTPAGGLNEFLSALVLNLMLGRLLPLSTLLKLDLCIESTIPFRGPDAAGRDSFALLDARLRAMNARWGLGLAEDEICDTLWLAVRVANKDVESFADCDPSAFLAKTWRLLPENNIPLRSPQAYTIREYRQALQHTEAFFSRVDPWHVFHQFAGVPDNVTFQAMVATAGRNIDLASRYLRVKLLAQAVLEALAESTGGDAPLASFVGELPPANGSHRMETYLPALAEPAWAGLDADLYRLLQLESRAHPEFDLNTSPLSLFIYRCIRPEALDLHLEHARQMFAGRLAPADFLAGLGRGVVAPVARAGAAMVFPRSAGLLKFCT